MAIKLLTDSTSYIPKSYIEKYDISIISLNVIIENESFKEVNLENKTFYDKISGLNKIPTSSQPSIQDLIDSFVKPVKNGDSVIGIFISSKMSGTYQTALMAKNMVLEDYPDAKIEIMDSLSNCMQLGYIVIQGARAIEKGKSLAEVVDTINHTIKSTRFIFMPATLEHLRKGGRIGNARALIGEVLKIKPVLTVQDGLTTTLSKIRTKKRAINHIIDTFLSDVEKYGYVDAAVHHINCPEEAIKIAEMIKDKTGKILEVCPIGPVVGVHVGPGALGIAYCTKNEIINKSVFSSFNVEHLLPHKK